MGDTWRISRRSYYADWFTIPILGCSALLAELLYHGLTAALLFGLLAGALLMSLFEYSIHRWAFHNPRLYRREHWLHHIRPTDFVGIPGWHTALYFVLAYGGFVGSFGMGTGTGLFVGTCAAYLTYIVSHDYYHHGTLGSGTGYWHRQARRHFLHHERGVEANFGVSSPLWDLIMGTYRKGKG